MWFCPKCKIFMEDNFTKCLKCKMSRLESTSEETIKMYCSSDSVESKYPALRVISGLFNFIAGLFAIITIIGIILVLSNDSGDKGLLISLGILLIGVIIFISLRAVAEIIKVFIDIEENTRRISK